LTGVPSADALLKSLFILHHEFRLTQSGFTD
jgi:hypothetical protein